MKLVNYNEFIKMPTGTVFCEFEPCIRGELKVKGDSIEDFDYIEMELRGEFKSDKDQDPFIDGCDRLVKGENLRADFDTFGRDGLFDKTRQYIVYDKQDVKELITFLNTLL